MKIIKYQNNPILSPFPGSFWESFQTRNPAAIYHDKSVYLLYSAMAEHESISTIYLGLARSADGYHFERVSKDPIVRPSMEDFGGFDNGGVEDARAVKIGNTIYITYVARAVGWSAFHRHGMRRPDVPQKGMTWTENCRRGALLSTTDMKTFTKHGPITSEDIFDANLALFPEKINGRFALLHRPSRGTPSNASATGNPPGISIMFSEDFKNWHDDQPLAYAQFAWEDNKIGGGPPPIKTDAGWLVIYHAVEGTAYQPIIGKKMLKYRAGVMLLDIKDPTKIIARAPNPIMEPEADFERYGAVHNVVFPTGTVILGDELFIYYGAGDMHCCVATVKLKELIDYVWQFRNK